MPQVCSVCQHESRGEIDRCLASGASLRDVAGQYGVSRSAVDRHQEHVLKTVRQAMAKRKLGEDRKTTSAWVERLDDAYAAAKDGMDMARNDPKQWPHGAKFVMAAAKLIETGLRVDGVIAGGGDQTTTINVEQVLVLPMKPAETHSLSDSSIETYALPSPESLHNE